MTGTVLESLRQFRAGSTPERIAQERGFTVGTIVGHLCAAWEAGERFEVAACLSPTDAEAIAVAVKDCGGFTGGMKPVFERLGGRLDYGRIKLWRLLN